jgi:uncharacterized protein (DUF1800 family)
MRQTRNGLLIGILCLTFAGFTVVAVGKKTQEIASVNDRQRVLHALNRFTFGPKPGDADRVSQQGVDKWFEQQLQPEKIDDAALEARLVPLRTLRMDTREIVENFPPPQVIKAIIDGKDSMPRDSAKRAIYEAEIARYEDKQDRKAERKTDDAKNSATDSTNATASPSDAASVNKTADVKPTDTRADDKSAADEAEKARRREAKLYADMKAEELLNLPPDQRMQEIIKMPPDEQRALLNGKSDTRDQVMATLSPEQRETAMALLNPQQVVQSEVMQAKLLRATYSERQLQEVMTDFWFNHFNVFVGKGADRYLITSYERDVIRPNALGKFEDLLVATAKSPAMLFYLDNWLSVGPDSDEAQGLRRKPQNRDFNRGFGGRGMRRRFPAPPPPPRQAKVKRKLDGLNENYGRELMELHTLGVNGGYTQRDVTEVARVFTGWTIREPRKGGDFTFEERRHEPGTKIVLGKKIKEHGEKEGLEVLHLLAHHPSTAKFICTKLAQRFVSDNPPQPLVDRMTETFLKKKGDIREVLRTMYKSPEFWAPETYQAKVKTPLEFVVSALRATDADVQDASPLLGALQNMGMPLYGMQPPTGYSMKSDSWVNSSALLGRMNFALGLGNDKFKGVKANTASALGAAPPADAHQTLTAFEQAYLDGDVSQQTHDAIVKQLDDPQITQRKLDDKARTPNAGAIAGLILGSPEFQKR